METKGEVSKNISRARMIIDGVRGAHLDPSSLADLTVDLATCILDESNRIETKGEKAQHHQLLRMMQDPMGKAFTTALTDQCFRTKKYSRTADQLTSLIDLYGIPKYFSWWKQLGMHVIHKIGKAAPFLFVPATTFMLKQETSGTIISASKGKLKKHILKRKRQGISVNLNRLGEAMLGESDALLRQHQYLEDLANPLITYMSVKISTIYSQINILAHHETQKHLTERLRTLYRAAMNNAIVKEDGTKENKFLNLDMEEYRDLSITVELFMNLLSEVEFKNLSAGIVLQAYIPDSFTWQVKLTQWAKQRVAEGGAPIKIRIVKGANLQPEHFESCSHDWELPIFRSKAEVDANYKKMVTYAFRSENARAVHIGIGSHNIFDIAYAMLLRATNDIEPFVIFEMLEGMAENTRRVVHQLAGEILLYCPVVHPKDFHIAVAYLTRRFDESTAADNFLRHAWGLTSASPAWDEQILRFRNSLRDMSSISATPRRTQNRLKPQPPVNEKQFQGSIDTDFILPENQQWAAHIYELAKAFTNTHVPLVINGKEMKGADIGKGIDPSNPKETAYTYDLADLHQVNTAIESAKAYEGTWGGTSPEQRAKLIFAAANLLEANRNKLMAAEVIDAGKTLLESDPEITEAIDFATYYAHSILEMQKHEDLSWKPKGTILVTPPWNFPVAIPLGGVFAALAAGNCVIFKPSPETVLCAWEAVQCLWEAGIPKEAVQFVNCPDEPVGSHLIKDPRINGVILTGATSTAKLFLKMRPDLALAAETGGKNAMIISNMSDADAATKDLIQSAFGHSGQKCSAASLAILVGEVYENKDFLKQLKDAAASLAVGPAWNPKSKVIPLISRPNPNLKKAIEKLDDGEKWLLKPQISATNPHLVTPGIKMGVKPGSFSHTNEFFGPILSLMKAKDIHHAIELANGTPYGLTSGIFSLDQREIDLWLEKIHAGNLYVNRGITGAIVERQPFGGCKASSYGAQIKAGGPNYVSQFCIPHQIALPKEVKAPKHEVNRLVNFLSGDDLTQELFVSLCNYSYWADYFTKKQDHSLIPGQDNFQVYKPLSQMAFRVYDQDKLVDTIRVIAAALSAGVSLEVSFTETSPVPFDDKWKKEFPSLKFVQESEKSFIERVKKNKFDRIRTVRKPSHELVLAATSTETPTYICSAHVLANGRFELLHYLREEAQSINYHRYGNLGLRESEARKTVK